MNLLEKFRTYQHKKKIRKQLQAIFHKSQVDEKDFAHITKNVYGKAIEISSYTHLKSYMGNIDKVGMSMAIESWIFNPDMTHYDKQRVIQAKETGVCLGSDIPLIFNCMCIDGFILIPKKEVFICINFKPESLD